MPLPTRTVTLTVAASAGILRAFTKASDGSVREACNKIPESTFYQAIKSEKPHAVDLRRKWVHGNLTFHCHPNSALCALSWGTSAESLFYQDIRGHLRERRLDADKWHLTGFEEFGALLGTNIAAVSAEDGSRVCVFFQSARGGVCYRTATAAPGGAKWTWSKDVHTVTNTKACKGTGIGVTAWNNLGEIRVFFQDESRVVHEYHGHLTKNSWEHVGFSKTFSNTIGDITAISWEDKHARQIRLYLQDEHNTIIEWAHDGKRWVRGDFMKAALPNADVIALVRDVGQNGEHVQIPNVFWVGQDQVLYQRIYVPHGDGYRWLEAVPIDTIGDAGGQVGSWEGAYFTDEAPEDEDTDRIVHSVSVRTAQTHITALALDFTDGSATGWHGEAHGAEHKFTLKAGEDIWRVLYHANDKHILGLRFVTSTGRESQWFGLSTEKPGEWSHEGAALEGFCGTAEKELLGLMPLWSDRLSYATLDNINDMLTEGARLKTEVEQLSKKLPALETSSAELARLIQSGYTDSALETMDAFVRLAGWTEYLHDLTHVGRKAHLGKEDERRQRDLDEQLKACQEQTQVLLRCVDTLGGKARQLGVSSTKVHSKAAEIDAEVKTLESRLSRLLERTGKKARKLESYRAGYQEALSLAEKELENLKHRLASLQESHRFEQTARTLEANSSSDEDGEADDKLHRKFSLFALKSRKAVTEDDIRVAQENVEEQRQSLEECRGLLAQTEESVAKFSAVHHDAHATLQAVVGKMRELAPVIDQDRALREAAEKLSTLLEKLRVSSVAMEDNTTATEYAEELLVVLADLLAIEVLKKQLPHAQITVVTKVLRGISNFMY
ncbi:hypothetical protein PHLGIDRAFT_129897 [Phlebiopsis gigantea 11061_1 CR5-6]|uniref:Jacalin-type lectin domain-containing protein n=1 Tax=Phlebiopsis gigantea (strain 11061_1 CR5-6) TaxID=745531 RepID=A0A0C3NGJ6_PHLG1|nr:hypothetical protein PHLGIDRAFT_129897 [Phlebiopsis gigantea 11061_1 CR5-6]